MSSKLRPEGALEDLSLLGRFLESNLGFLVTFLDFFDFQAEVDSSLKISGVFCLNCVCHFNLNLPYQLSEMFPVF